MSKRWNRRVRELVSLQPTTPGQLHRFLQTVLGLNVPRRAMVEGHAAPFDYLCNAFFEVQPDGTATTAITSLKGDCVVWANRGGGKTMLGAAATLLDMVFKPGVQVRILGGSLEQSSKMFEHLVSLFDRPAMRGMLASVPTQRRVVTVHGSVAQVLAQSQRSVRGVRVHKLRCDEVEEFDQQVWEAAQLTTRSGWCGEGSNRLWVNGRVEALSTMHRPFGMMNRLTGGKGRQVFRWNYLDVIERCAPERVCDTCVLWDNCGGRAKEATGFVRVDDLIRQWHRTATDTWAAEMLCARPRRSESVYPNFSVESHVVRRTVSQAKDEDQTSVMVGGMDFGLRSPTVMLWAWVDGDGEQTRVHVVDEYVQAGCTMAQHIEAIAAQARTAAHARPHWLGVDPAGRQRNSHSGLSDVELLRRAGYQVRTQRSTIREGVERIRRRLDHGTLSIDPRCVQLIEAMQMYHFDPDRPSNDEPVKDGPDHVCDALRYLVVNLEHGSGAVQVRRWA